MPHPAGSGFHWFVAWRYLLARPRRVSIVVVFTTGLFAVAALTLRAVGQYVLSGADPTELVSQGSPYRDQILLAGVGIAALAELSLVLAIVRYFFTFFTSVSISGVAIGSMALVIVLSVMSGFENDLRGKILGTNAHVLITKEDGEFTEYREVAAAAAKIPGVVAHTPYVTSEVVIAANSNYANVIIKGIDPETIGEVTELEKNLEHPEALDALWPLSRDGEIVGPPEPEPEPDTPPEPPPEDEDGDVVDPVPPDFDVPGGAPEDFSAGADPDAVAAEAAADADGDVIDPVPEDFAVPEGEPADFSGDDDDALAEDYDDIVPDDFPDLDEAEEAIAGFGTQDGPARGDDFWTDDDELTASPRIPPRVAVLSGVLVGRELVKQIHLYVGQEVRMISPLSDPINPGGTPVPYTRNYRVAGTFFTGMYEYDLKFVYVELESLQEFLDLGDQVNGIEIRVEDPEETGPVLEALRRQLGPGYRVQDWKEINRGLFSALELEKKVMFLVLAIIILVASFSIIGNLMMVVVEKAKEIALLKTLGASNAGVMKVFIAQGFFIGLVGTVIGVSHGLVACYLGQRYGLPLDPDVYYIDRLPIHVETGAVVAVAAAGVLISVVATIYPAYVAARLRPIEGLRYE